MGDVVYSRPGFTLMTGSLVTTAIVPAFCEEAIRSSYLFYLGDRGARRRVVISLAAVFIIGEVAYDASIYPLAKAELGSQTAIVLFAMAILSGALLHAALTLWTPRRQRKGQSVWAVFLIALTAHFSFNLVALSAMGALL